MVQSVNGWLKSIPIIELCIALMVLLIGTQLYYITGYAYYAHDDLMNIESYVSKLKGEGRWINHLFFHFFKSFPPAVITGLSWACFAYYIYICAQSMVLNGNVKARIAIALAALSVPTVYLMSWWPLTSFSCYVSLALAAYLYKKIPTWLFLLIFAIVFNGVISHYYFLLPLLFLNKDDLGQLWKTLLLWIIFYVVGYGVANLAVFVRFQNFITLEWWRYPHYITDWQSLCENVEFTFNCFWKHVSSMNVATWGLVSVAFIFFVLDKTISAVQKVMLVLLFMLVSYSIYALSTYAGLNVVERSAFGLYLAVFMFCMYSLRYYRYVQIIVCLMFCMFHYHSTQPCIAHVHKMSHIWLDSIKEIPIKPYQVRGIIMVSDDQKFTECQKVIDENMKLKTERQCPVHFEWYPAVLTAGFPRCWLINTVGAEKPVGFDESTLEFKPLRSMYDYAMWGNWLVLRLK